MLPSCDDGAWDQGRGVLLGSLLVLIIGVEGCSPGLEVELNGQ